jgi:hypothetical protein
VGKGYFLNHEKRKTIKDFQFCLPILPAYLPLKSPNGHFPLNISGPISQATLEQNKNKNFFFTTGEKFKDFQFCLLILPAYLPLKFPNGQFPLKIPGTISQAKLKPKKKQIAPFKKRKKI